MGRVGGEEDGDSGEAEEGKYGGGEDLVGKEGAEASGGTGGADSGHYSFRQWFATSRVRGLSTISYTGAHFGPWPPTRRWRGDGRWRWQPPTACRKVARPLTYVGGGVGLSMDI